MSEETRKKAEDMFIESQLELMKLRFGRTITTVEQIKDVADFFENVLGPSQAIPALLQTASEAKAIHDWDWDNNIHIEILHLIHTVLNARYETRKEDNGGRACIGCPLLTDCGMPHAKIARGEITEDSFEREVARLAARLSGGTNDEADEYMDNRDATKRKEKLPIGFAPPAIKLEGSGKVDD